jgi:hypothetical protein
MEELLTDLDQISIHPAFVQMKNPSIQLVRLPVFVVSKKGKQIYFKIAVEHPAIFSVQVEEIAYIEQSKNALDRTEIFLLPSATISNESFARSRVGSMQLDLLDIPRPTAKFSIPAIALTVRRIGADRPCGCSKATDSLARMRNDDGPGPIMTECQTSSFICDIHCIDVDDPLLHSLCKMWCDFQDWLCRIFEPVFSANG